LKRILFTARNIDGNILFNCLGSLKNTSTMISRPRGVNPYNVAALTVLTLGLLLTTLNIYQLRQLQDQHYRQLPDASDDTGGMSRKYAVFAKNEDSGYLKHVYNVLERAGYSKVSYNVSQDWSVMWAHDYPFKKLKHLMTNLRPGQRVNKLPGSGFVTNKVNLATSDLPAVPKALKIPQDKAKLLEFARSNPEVKFVQKNSNHRGIKIEKIGDLDLDLDSSKDSSGFVQVFVDDPLLIDGYKFDIGVYTVITSIDPLRIYVFQGDALVRFCPEKYYPFDAGNRDKYVVHDDYRPTWNVPTMAKFYSDLGYTFRETLDAHLQSVGGGGPSASDQVWEKMYEVIRQTYKAKEPDLIKAASSYAMAKKAAFFELVRFDFVVDARLNVYLMEANMSPNLSSKHFAQNRLLYEQVVYNLLRLVGVARPGVQGAEQQGDGLEMQVSDKDLLASPPALCASAECSKPDACQEEKCWLCKKCLSADDLAFLRTAFLEHINKHQMRRIYPEPLVDPDRQPETAAANNRTVNNRKMHQWFNAKCAKDPAWCR